MGLKKFGKKLKKGFKKIAKSPIGKIGLAAAAGYGGFKLGGALGIPGFSSNGSMEEGPAIAGDPNAASLPPVNISGDRLSPGAWSSLGNLGSAALSLYGGMQANNANARQAENQMDFQREMSNTSYQRGTEDMKAAGLNPMLAYSQGGASAPGGASASMDDAITPALNSGRSAAMLEATMENLGAQNAAIKAGTRKTQAETITELLRPENLQALTGNIKATTANTEAATTATKQDTERDRQTFSADVEQRKSASRLSVLSEAGAKNQAEFQKTAVGALMPYLTNLLNFFSSATDVYKAVTPSKTIRELRIPGVRK